MRLLRTELRGLPRDRRREVLAQIDEPITAYRSDTGAEGKQDIAAVLQRLGDPAEIGADARDRFGIKPRRARAPEAIALLLIGLGRACDHHPDHRGRALLRHRRFPVGTDAAAHPRRTAALTQREAPDGERWHR